MRLTIHDLWNDERGIVISAELVTIATVVVAGVMVGFVCVRDALVNELTDVGNALTSLNQSYSFTGFTHADGGKTYSTTSGSSFSDTATTGQVNIGGAGGGGLAIAGGLAGGGGGQAGGFAAGGAAAGARVQEFAAGAAAEAEVEAEAEAEATAEVQSSGICEQAGPMFVDPNSILTAPGTTILQGPGAIMNQQGLYSGSGAYSGSGIYSGSGNGSGDCNPGGMSLAPQTFAPQTIAPQTYVPQNMYPQTYMPQAVPQMFVPEAFVPIAPMMPPSFGPMYYPYSGPTINRPMEGCYY